MQRICIVIPTHPTSSMPKALFKQQVMQAREAAILTTVNRLLAEKGFDLMTVDAVAAEVGIAKASLYKHFSSKEALAAAAMVGVMDRALAKLSELAQTAQSPLDCLRAVARWALQMQLAGEMPSLPAHNSSLRTALAHHSAYMERLVALSEQLGRWITEAQSQGQLNAQLPPELVLYTLFARACDPVLGLLKLSGQYSDARIIELILGTCFDGLCRITLET
jgi:TetR/AcrR family transcriptional regulator, regulator of autoinduction and epiphytic fitness